MPKESSLKESCHIGGWDYLNSSNRLDMLVELQVLEFLDPNRVKSFLQNFCHTFMTSLGSVWKA